MNAHSQDPRIGYLCSYVPPEMIEAAGAVPVRIRAPGCTSTATADTYMSHRNCSFVRSCLELLMTSGRLDGIVLTNSCDHMRRLYDILREKVSIPFVHMLGVPKNTGSSAGAWFREELVDLREALERATGVPATGERLRGAIDARNETRRLLERLAALRTGERPRISGAETMAAIHAGDGLTAGEHSDLLARLLAEVEGRAGIAGYRARLMLAGSAACGDADTVAFLEKQGGLVVTDSLCAGSRSFLEPVPDGDDPLEGLALAGIARPGCASMTDGVGARSEYIQEMVARHHVDGVVFQRLRNCDLWGGQLLFLSGALEAASIPLLVLEREYASGCSGQLGTRIQAFLEMIER